MLAVHIGFTIVEHTDYHLKVEVEYCLKNSLVNVKIRIIDLQHELLTVFLHKEYLGLTRVIAQTLDVSITDTFQHETIIIDVFLLWSLFVGSDCSTQRCTCHSNSAIKAGWSHGAIKISRTHGTV